MSVADVAEKRLVVHVITGLKTGGAEMMLFKLLSHWTSPRLESRVISLSAGGAMGARLEAAGVTIDYLNVSQAVPSPRALTRLRRNIRRTRPDLIQGWMYHGNLAATVAAWFCGGNVPVVWNVRQTLYDLRRERPFTRMVIRANALLSARADAIIYNSRTSARQHESLGFSTGLTQLIPNGFDTRVFSPDPNGRARIRRELGLSDDAVLIGLIARYHPMKDHATFLKAAALLARECQDVRFVLAGRDVDAANPALVSMIAEYELGGRVFLLGEREDTPQLNAALDIASSTSAWGEGFANVVGEAMSCGVPCVVTDIGDSAWIVGDAGLVVPPDNPEALAVAWKTLVSLGPGARQAMGALARQRIVESFSVGPVVKRYEDLYESLIAQVEN